MTATPPPDVTVWTDEYRTMRSEALVLRDAHQYPALRIGIVTIVRGES